MRGEGCAAAPSAMAVDITLLFKASVKTVKTRNKALGVAAGDSARDELLKRGAARSKSDFTGRAREVVSAGRRKRGDGSSSSRVRAALPGEPGLGAPSARSPPAYPGRMWAASPAVGSEPARRPRGLPFLPGRRRRPPGALPTAAAT